MTKGKRNEPTTPDEKPEAESLDDRALKIARETLTGDIRDIMLNDMKDRKTSLPWNLRNEAAQQELIDQVTRMAESIVTRTVKIVAAGGRRTIQAHLKKITVTDSIKVEIELSKMDQQRHDLIDATGASVLIVVADAEIYEGERAPVTAKPDQKPMFDPDTGEIDEAA